MWFRPAVGITILHGRRDESFADDLNKKRGIVRCRVALLLRSLEIQPAVSKIRALLAPPPPPSASLHEALFER